MFSKLRQHLVFTLLLLLAVVEAGVSNVFGADPLCIHQIVRFLEPGKRKNADLPETAEFKINQEKAYELFKKARKRWLKAFDEQELTELLTELKEGEKTTLTKPEWEFLLKVRRRGVALDEAYKLFDQSHEFPEGLRPFIKQLGRLKDALKSEKKKMIQKKANRLLKMMEDVPTEKSDIDIEPARWPSTSKFLDKTLSETQKLLNQKKLNAHQYHRIRKNLRSIEVVFRLLERFDNDAEAAVVANYLDKVTADMEVIQNKLVKTALKEKIDYDAQPVEIPSALRKRIQFFLDRVE